ncbi:hypothetical protein HMPREF1544_03815 [Mucor circinelloides 1006PhL]|uniref:PHD-type domain-containing protein n=1 Tax=Mucor circinelloides f. circinelloides (strain 1006PhL) TaxID=1220926 RepID=S2JG71_MUCC1|nr:hypothetical protein HMPREF1544_03815 [Mucor circinelloides 1006PhL]KAG1093934.1 hypothetical protein G6F42_018853 [Rhizopus arrhizus]
MEGLDINTIPSKLLGRILLQIPNLLPPENLDLINTLQSGLQQFGKTDKLDAFIDYCQTLNNSETPLKWKTYTITNNDDWEIANYKKSQELAGIRFLLASETGRPIPVNDLLQDTLRYLQRENDHIDPVVEALIQLRLDKYDQDKSTFERQTSELDATDYHLLGALMVRYDSIASRGSAPRSWCLYLRDYVENADGSVWRILLEDDESRVTSDQALADIRGAIENKASPSEFSKDYRPVYLFYGNLDISQQLQQPLQGGETAQDGSHVITLEDYTFDDEYDQLLQEPEQEFPQEEEELCKHCGIKDIVEDINDMFFCELCNQGVHQFCEDPPIQKFEKDVDPWWCRACSKAQNIPIPTAASFFRLHTENEAMNDENALKRKREEETENHAATEGDGFMPKKLA